MTLLGCRVWKLRVFVIYFWHIFGPVFDTLEETGMRIRATIGSVLSFPGGSVPVSRRAEVT